MHVTTGLLWAFCGAVLVSQLSTPCVAQATDDPLRLIHPNVAAELELSDEQRAKLQQLIQERDAAIAAAPDDAAALTDDFGGKMLGVLTAEQLARFQADDNELLKFNFQEQKWDAVLNWFAKQDGAALVMDEVPPGTFSYSDTKGYTPTQAIDLLNSVLLTRGYTLIRQERMLIVIRLSDTIPLEFFPRVTLDELPSRGRFEMVSVEFNIGGRVMANVLQAVEGYIGQYGRLIPLTGSQKLLVVESAGKMQTINVLIAAVPVPKAPPAPRPPEKPPQPVFASYSIGDLDPDSTCREVAQIH